MDETLAQTGYSTEPITIQADTLLYEAVNLFNEHEIDSIIVLENNAPLGILDIQDLVKLGLLG
jgi:CBS domain-containing protein